MSPDEAAENQSSEHAGDDAEIEQLQSELKEI